MAGRNIWTTLRGFIPWSAKSNGFDYPDEDVFEFRCTAFAFRMTGFSQHLRLFLWHFVAILATIKVSSGPIALRILRILGEAVARWQNIGNDEHQRNE